MTRSVDADKLYNSDLPHLLTYFRHEQQRGVELCHVVRGSGVLLYVKVSDLWMWDACVTSLSREMSRNSDVASAAAVMVTKSAGRQTGESRKVRVLFLAPSKTISYNMFS
jgi:hypothetical protein